MLMDMHGHHVLVLLTELKNSSDEHDDTNAGKRMHGFAVIVQCFHVFQIATCSLYHHKLHHTFS